MARGVRLCKIRKYRKLTSSNIHFHRNGLYFLNQRLANDEVLAVAYQYTIGDQVYQVGEFGTDGVDATNVSSGGIPNSQALILKLLKSNFNSFRISNRWC